MFSSLRILEASLQWGVLCCIEADDDEADQPAFEHYQSMRCNWMLEDHTFKRPLPPDSAMHYAHARELQKFLVAVKQDPQEFATRIADGRLTAFGDGDSDEAHVCEMPQSRPVRWARELHLSRVHLPVSLQVGEAAAAPCVGR
eukprot:2384704-Amphidinium_carterae.4